MLGFFILLLIVGGFIGLLYYNITIYGKPDENAEYSENNMMENIETIKKEEKEKEKKKKKEKESEEEVEEEEEEDIEKED